MLELQRSRISHPTANRPRKLRRSQRVAGSWDLVRHRVAPAAGNAVETHLVHLRWLAGAVVGSWDISTEVVARPGHEFSQARSTSCRLRRRRLLYGEPRGARIELAPPSPLGPPEKTRCGVVPPPLRACALRHTEGRLELSCAGQRWRFSKRRSPTPPLAMLLAPAGLTGVWTWHHRSVDPEGDLKIEHETWHLVQKGRHVEGFYDRVVRIRSRDGRPFSCNEALGYDNAARFRVRGLVVGGEVYLKEISYTTSPSRCETGRRRLDRYIGKLGEGGRIQLRWPSGAQLLRPRR